MEGAGAVPRDADHSSMSNGKTRREQTLLEQTGGTGQGQELGGTKTCPGHGESPRAVPRAQREVLVAPEVSLSCSRAHQGTPGTLQVGDTCPCCGLGAVWGSGSTERLILGHKTCVVNNGTQSQQRGARLELGDAIKI